MPAPEPITIPLVNTNEPEAVLVAVHVTEGQAVQPGDLVCTLETSKSTLDVAVESAGYVIGLHPAVGEIVHAGDLLCYLAETPDAVPISGSPSRQPGSQPTSSAKIPDGLRITQPALNLTQELGIDLSDLPLGPLITEAFIQQRQPGGQAQTGAGLAHRGDLFDPAAIIIYGGGGHGKSLIDLVRAMGTYRIAGIVDDGLAKAKSPNTVMGIPILGGSEALSSLYQQGVRLAVNAVGGIGNLAVRVKVFDLLMEAGFACPAVVHPRAVVEPTARLQAGVQVFALAYVGSEVEAGFGAIINTHATISHECRLGKYANISPGAVLAGQVEVGSGALIGMGATVNLQVKIGERALVGNGATVKKDVPASTIVRAGSTWPQ